MKHVVKKSMPCLYGALTIAIQIQIQGNIRFSRGTFTAGGSHAQPL